MKTISKCKDRDFIEDKSSRPYNKKTTLTTLEKELVRVVRTMTWIKLDDLTDIIVDYNVPMFAPCEDLLLDTT